MPHQEGLALFTPFLGVGFFSFGAVLERSAARALE